MPDQQLIGYDDNGKPIYAPTGGGRASGPPQQAGGGGRGGGGAGPAGTPSQGGRASGPSTLTPVVSAADRDRPIEGWDKNGKPIYGAKKPEAPETPQTRTAWGEFAPSIDPIGIIKGLFQVGNDVRLASQGRAMETEEAKRIMNVWAAETGDRGAGDNTLRAIESIPFVGPHLIRQGENAAVGNWPAFAGGVAGLTFDLAAPELAGKGLKVPGRQAPVGGAARIIAPKIEKVANAGSTRRIVDVIAPKTGPNKARFGNMAEDVAPGLAREPGLGAWSASGLETKLEPKMGEAVSALDEAADARNAGRAHETGPIIEALKKERAALTAEAVEGSRPVRETTVRESPILDERGKPIQVTEQKAVPIGNDTVPPHNAVRVAQIDSAIAQLQELGPVARYEAIRRIRASFDKPARMKYHPSLTADFLGKTEEAAGAAAVTGRLRSALGSFDPAQAKANKRYSFLKDATDVLEARAETERVRPNRAGPILTRAASAGAGAATGGIPGWLAGMAGGEVANRIASSGFTPKIKIARGLANIADAAGRTTGTTATNATRAAILSALLADQRKPQTEEQRKRYEQYKKEHPD